MVKNTIGVLAVLAFLALGVSAQANVSIIKKGETALCENASWVVYNLSETAVTTVEFDIGPQELAWEPKPNVRGIKPGDYLANALEVASKITNQGPGDLSVNCQRQRFDRNDWRIDAGSGKTYQSNYEATPIVPQLYIEPGYGQPFGTEGRDVFGTQGNRSEANR